MRIQTLILFLLLCLASGYAKDVITKTDGTKIDAKVEEITESVIKYRKATNPTGPVYSIPVSSVTTVLYENGDIDNFNSSDDYSLNDSRQNMMSKDDDLVQLAPSPSYNLKKDNASDSELLKITYGKTQSEMILDRAANLKKIGWIIGGSIAGAGLIAGSIVGFGLYDSLYLLPIIAGPAVLCGGAICIFSHVKANAMMKEVGQFYFSLGFENKLIQFRNNTLTAGINVMGNRVVNSHSLGLSIGLNF